MTNGAVDLSSFEGDDILLRERLLFCSVAILAVACAASFNVFCMP